jgi:hypothetical protein
MQTRSVLVGLHGQSQNLGGQGWSSSENFISGFNRFSRDSEGDTSMFPSRVWKSFVMHFSFENSLTTREGECAR